MQCAAFDAFALQAHARMAGVQSRQFPHPVSRRIYEVSFGADNSQIFGGMRTANPVWYGGEAVIMFGGVEIAVHRLGLARTRLAIKAGAPVYQNLNGPQMGQDWQLNAVLGVRF